MTQEFRIEDAARALDQQSVLDWRRGWQVIDPAGGSNLVTTGAGEWEVDVAAGDVNLGGSVVSATAQTLDFAADVGTDPRMAVVYRDAAGDVQAHVGAEGAIDPAGASVRGAHTPQAETLANVNGTVLALVLLDPAVGEVTPSEIQDRRLPASIIVDNADVGTLVDGADNSIENFAGQNLAAADGVLNAADQDPSRATDEKLFFGDGNEWSLRYDGTAGAWVIRDETADAGAGADVLTFNDAADAIETARSIGTSAEPVPGTSHFNAISTEEASIDGVEFRTELDTDSGTSPALSIPDGDNLTDFSKIVIEATATMQTADPVTVTFDGDDAAGNENYNYTQFDGAENPTQDAYEIFKMTTTSTREVGYALTLYPQNGEIMIFSEFALPVLGNRERHSVFGGYRGADQISSIDFSAHGGTASATMYGYRQ